MARQDKKKMIEVATPILVVQRVTVEWTHLARGGEGARVRSAVDEAFVFPVLPEAEKTRVITHEIYATEDNHFIPETRKPRVQADQLELVRLLSWVHGETLTIAEGEWAQFLSNRSFISSDTYKKMYYKHVTNIGRFVHPIGTEFLDIPPRYRIDRRKT
jgi:hypothetical protein